MKITDPDVIKNGEQDLIASVQEDLDPETVRQIIKERLTVAALEPKGGQIVVHDNDIAFRMDFQVNLNGSLLFDRNGNLIEEADALPGQTSGMDAPAPETRYDQPDLAQDQPAELGFIPEENDAENEDEDKDEPDTTPDSSADPEPDSQLKPEIAPEIETDQDSEDDIAGDLDEDINDLLKESREFWAQTKKS